MRNLDLACARLGSDIAGIAELEEKTINAALSVLEEQGIYACFLYLQGREKKTGEEILKKLSDVIAQELSLDENRKPMAVAEKVSEDLDRLLFTRELLSRAMVYARHHLKARSGSRAGS
ncbi:MAG TPA: hypothetical protein ENK43_04700 [Planctomycetes bacterium]|nr:hypothetical protein [Planctomycetota bacterium]